MEFFLCMALAASVPPETLPVAPPPRQVVMYFPVSKGATWVYAVGDKIHTEVVTHSVMKHGSHLVTVATIDGSMLTPKEVVKVSKSGVSQVAVGGNDLGHQLHLLAFPWKPGQKWDYGSTTVEIVGREKVSTPAGTYESVRVVMTIDFMEGQLRRTYWYAPSIGAVKRVTTFGKNGREKVEVLQSFKPGQ